MIVLKERLKVIADRIKDKKTMADIGSDHGFLPIYLNLEYDYKKTILIDISEDSLKKGEVNCDKYKVKNYETRFGNGLKPLKPGEVDAVVIAGMGGKLIVEILEENIELSRSFSRFVLQPRIAQGVVRKWFLNNGYTITNEDLVYEGKFIPQIITVQRDNFGSASKYLAAIEEYKKYVSSETILYEVPPWIVKAQGPVKEYLNRRLTMEIGKRTNILRAKEKTEELKIYVDGNIKYLEELLKKI